MTTFTDVAPILPVRDLAGALDRYSRMGFTTTRYAGPDAYGYARSGDVQLHLAQSDAHDPLTSSVMVYLYVDDADAVHAAWSVADLGGHHHPPHDTDYGLREASYVDPDGNLLRYGSWLPGHPTTDA